MVHLHPMWTRGAVGFQQPKLYIIATLSPIPKINSNRPRRSSLVGGYGGGVCRLHVQQHLGLSFTPSRRQYCHRQVDLKYKFKADGTLERYNACRVLCGFTQHPSVNYDETSSSVVKPTTVRIILSLSQDWPINHIDVKNAFLHGTLIETVYCTQPTSFFDPG
jgi:hypothetical protein